MQGYLKSLNSLNYNEFLEFRGRLYHNLRDGYENRAMQTAWIKAINDLDKKLAYIGDGILKTGLSELGRESSIYDKLEKRGVDTKNLDLGEFISEKLKKQGIDIKKVDDALSFYIQTYVNNDLIRLEFEFYLEEEQFNPANKNSLAHKFLSNLKKDEPSLEKIIDLKSDSWNARVNNDYYAKIRFEDDGILIDLKSDISFIRVDSPIKWATANLELRDYNFKGIGNNLKITFDIEYINFYNSGCSVIMFSDTDIYLGRGLSCKGHSNSTESWEIIIPKGGRDYSMKKWPKNDPSIGSVKLIDAN